jgi:hypothetical protein
MDVGAPSNFERLNALPDDAGYRLSSSWWSDRAIRARIKADHERSAMSGVPIRPAPPKPTPGCATPTCTPAPG